MGKPIDGRKYQKYCLHLASFQNVGSLAKQMLLILFFFPPFFSLCEKKSLGLRPIQGKIQSFIQQANTDCEPQSKEEACHKCGFMELKGVFVIPFTVYLPQMSVGEGGGAWEASPGITAVITHLLHEHACQFRVQLLFPVTPCWIKHADNAEMCP